MAAWGRDVRGPPRSRRPRERIRGRGRGCCSRHGPALGPPSPSPASARRSPAHRTPSLQPRRRRRRSVLRPKRRHDVLLARLRRSRLPTSLPLRFVYTYICHIYLAFFAKTFFVDFEQGKGKRKRAALFLSPDFHPPTFIGTTRAEFDGGRPSASHRGSDSGFFQTNSRSRSSVALAARYTVRTVRGLFLFRASRYAYIYIYIFFFFFPRYSTATPNDKFQRRERERERERERDASLCEKKFGSFLDCFRHRDGLSIRRGSRVRQLRGYIDAALEERRHRALSVQRVRTLSQDERNEQTPDKALETAGKSSLMETNRFVSLRRLQGSPPARSVHGARCVFENF